MLKQFPYSFSMIWRVKNVMKCKQNNKLSNCAARISVAFLLFSVLNYNLFIVPFSNRLSVIFFIQLKGLAHRNMRLMSRTQN